MAEGRTDRAADAALVRAVGRGSEDALALLYDRHADGIFGLVVRMTNDRAIAEEVVQETFLVLWNRAERYDPAIGSLAAWLNTIARNRTVDRLRAAGRRPRIMSLSGFGEDDGDEAALDRIVGAGSGAGSVPGGGSLGAAPGPEAALDLLVLRATLRAALDSMNAAERTVILLAYQEGLTQSEISARLGWPLGTVKTRTRRALLRLREAIAADLGDEPGLGVAPVPVADR